MQPTSDFIRVNGIQLHYLAWPGPGRPLVFLHGNSHCGGVWAPLAERLADTCHVLALDLRGHGESDKPQTGYDWGTLRDDLEGFLAALGLKDALLVGHSRGGGVAALGTATMPERVSGAVLYEPTLPFRSETLAEDPGRQAAALRLAQRAQRARERQAVFRSREELYERYRPRSAFKGWKEECFQAYINYGTLVREDGLVELRSPPWVEAKLYEELPRPEAWVGARAPTVPVLAVYGELGGRVRPGRDPAAALRRVFPECQVLVMAGATHFGPMEQPEAFELVVRQFARRPG